MNPSGANVLIPANSSLKQATTILPCRILLSKNRRTRSKLFEVDFEFDFAFDSDFDLELDIVIDLDFAFDYQ